MIQVIADRESALIDALEMANKKRVDIYESPSVLQAFLDLEKSLKERGITQLLGGKIVRQIARSHASGASSPKEDNSVVSRIARIYGWNIERYTASQEKRDLLKATFPLIENQEIGFGIDPITRVLEAFKKEDRVAACKVASACLPKGASAFGVATILSSLIRIDKKEWKSIKEAVSFCILQETSEKDALVAFEVLKKGDVLSRTNLLNEATHLAKEEDEIITALRAINAFRKERKKESDTLTARAIAVASVFPQRGLREAGLLELLRAAAEVKHYDEKEVYSSMVVILSQYSHEVTGIGALLRAVNGLIKKERVKDCQTIVPLIQKGKEQGQALSLTWIGYLLSFMALIREEREEILKVVASFVTGSMDVNWILPVVDILKDVRPVKGKSEVEFSRLIKEGCMKRISDEIEKSEREEFFENGALIGLHRFMKEHKVRLGISPEEERALTLARRAYQGEGVRFL